MARLSLMLMCYNTAHLLGRTLETLKNQGLDDWELIIIDDMSEDDIPAAIANHGDGLPIIYQKLNHDIGMRGNTASINHGISISTGELVMWSTPEVMLSPLTLRAVHDKLSGNATPTFITIPSHGLTYEVQMELDNLDWKTNIHTIKDYVNTYPDEDFIIRWFYLNFYEHGDRSTPHRDTYGNNQTVAVNKSMWLDKIGYFPLFYDYGSDDPWVAGERGKQGYTDVTLWDYEAYHQWHPKAQHWIAQGKAPNWNALGHTMRNIANDPRIPDGGTCAIWDGGNHDQLSAQQIADELTWVERVKQTGFRRK